MAPKVQRQSAWFGARPATGRRAERVAERIMAVLSEALLRRVNDPRLEGLTITGVQVTGDLRRAKVFYSCLAGPEGLPKVAAGLASAARFLRAQVAGDLNLRYAPELDFRPDDTAFRAQALERLMEELAADDEPDTPRDP
ncbi:MAG: 30S ribosome-binding factor RbfA [Thermodesulfobacteriota bacterium]